jgi:hypothetical protein
MQRLIRGFALVLLLASSTLAWAEGYYLGRLRLALIDDPVRIEFQSGAAVPTLDTLQQAIKSGAAAQGWKITNQTDGRMELLRIVRDEHTMIIEVTYDPTGYRVRYLQSTNLMYDEQGAKGRNLRVIHGNYNEWINDLVLAINGGLGTRTQTTIGFARVDRVDAVPFVNDRGRTGYREFLDLTPPRAFAIAPNGAWGRSSRQIPNARFDAAEIALEFCNRRGNGQCKLYAIDERVVWRFER